MYKYERNGEGSLKIIPGETCSGTYCNDNVTRDDYIDNPIGLAYQSDFGFAAKDKGENNCSNNMYSSSNCASTYNWMSTGRYVWTITQFVSSSYARSEFNLGTGYLGHSVAEYKGGVRLTLYLKFNTLITSGTRTSSDPFQISLLYVI